MSTKERILSRLPTSEPEMLTENGLDKNQARIKSDLLNQFISELKNNAAGVSVCETENLSETIKGFINNNQLPPEILSNAMLDIDLSPIKVSKGRATGQEIVGLSVAKKGISETGTLVLVSSPENPTSINFLVDFHIVVIHQEDIEGTLESVMVNLGKECEDARAINFISGPSRTADIEQTIQLGAHGPRHLHVIILKNS